ncbi:DNA polymerase III subunit epsilon [Erythrobacter sp. NAP1]|uniref:exonuclease domain-containing protein n=1 Tax=Erythrobacter sp. NAP1 TaxID=237727 RepID=UPI00006875DC|nr:exonuclease domain-containing protein [Erythrobacter sp. NAP1]EAQ29068.1 DNA polymerase III subunit epsilon [Erythrobacter sp. NAP1]
MNMLARWRIERALAALRQSDLSLLQDYANAAWPSANTPASEAHFLALDFELDGLRKGAHLLQAGWTPFTAGGITFQNARSLDIRSDATLNREAVTVHGIGEDRASAGLPIGKVAEELLTALAGRVIVAHAAAIEVTAIKEAAKSLYNVNLPVRSICTLRLEKHIHPGNFGADAYRLGPTRERYGLPEYRAHDALTDAIAAAELFQAQLTRLSPDVTLGWLEAI